MKKKKLKEPTGRQFAWIAVAGAAVVGLFFWWKKGQGDTLRATFGVKHLGTEIALRKQLCLGNMIGGIFDEVGTLKSNQSLNLEYHPEPTIVTEEIDLVVPADTEVGIYTAELTIRNLDDSLVEVEGAEEGATRDLQENIVEIKEGGKIEVLVPGGGS